MVFAMTPRLAGGLLMLSFGVMELFLRQGATAKKIAPAPSDRGTSLLIVTAFVLAVLATSTRLLPAIELNSAIAWVGVGVGVCGIALRAWSMRVLGQYYTRTLVTTANQTVVRQGPYRLVRHPGYLGSILIWSGAAVASGNLLSVAAVTVLLAIAYTHRIRTEERMLIETLGNSYEEYRQKSWRLLPFVF
jgi:protein-S-isoprenylcysteine O-methyltransferase Ste14